MEMASFVRVWDYTWWLWLIIASLLLAGLLVSPLFFLAAIGLAFVQTVLFLVRERSLSAFSVQLRLAFLLMALIFYYPPLRVLYWIPVVGTFAMLFLGYCLLARLLSLLPWNRDEPLTGRRFRETFTTPPRLETTIAGAPATGCPGGVCTLEVQLGKRPAAVSH